MGGHLCCMGPTCCAINFRHNWERSWLLLCILLPYHLCRCLYFIVGNQNEAMGKTSPIINTIPLLAQNLLLSESRKWLQCGAPFLSRINDSIDLKSRLLSSLIQYPIFILWIETEHFDMAYWVWSCSTGGADSRNRFAVSRHWNCPSSKSIQSRSSCPPDRGQSVTMHRCCAIHIHGLAQH